MAWAHSANTRGERHDLVAHLRGVGEFAAEFGSAFDAAETARYLGLWHDIGKFNQAFQDYLLACEREPTRRQRGPDHKGAGALLATESLSFCALPVQGHHGGLRAFAGLPAWLNDRRSDPAVAAAIEQARRELPELSRTPALAVPEGPRHDPLAADLYLRFLFSALVDADYLDTERHFNPAQFARRRAPVPIVDLWPRFEASHRALSAHASPRVLDARRRVYEACLAASAEPPGLFRLTVPTGGGKTLSALAFALRHAQRHGLRRVIVAVPFITITEQTVDVYRKALEDAGDAAPIVLEHHSAVEPAESDEGEFEPALVWRRLAAENWDATIIVTTTVQLFQSLFGRRTSSSRKVHRLASSVIILDEAQALPSNLLQTILTGLQHLVQDCHTTVILSTATQPAFESIRGFAELQAREIVPDPAPLFSGLRRVDYAWRTAQPTDWPRVAEVMSSESQVLAIVNTKQDALDLLDALADPDALHLSTLLCGAHRRAVLQQVQRRLAAGEPCRLVSTQVVEAGVDLDFPVVLRALGPLDRVIQAAGRCNRAGRLDAGKVIIFLPPGPIESHMPRGAYAAGAGITAALVGAGALDPDLPATSSEYFRRLFDRVDTDSQKIQELRRALDYPAVGDAFRMIDQETVSVVVTGYGTEAERQNVRDWLDELRAPHAGTPLREILRRVQPYVVAVPRYAAEREPLRGLIAPIQEGLGEWLGVYDPVRGLGAADLGTEALVV